jgi:IS1 family transposase
MVKHRDEHGHLISTELRIIFGQPAEVLALFGKRMAYIERTHLTMRLFNGRLVRCTLGFSKDLDMYRASAA